MNPVNTNYGYLIYKEQTLIQGRLVYNGEEKRKEVEIQENEERRTIFEEVRLYQNKLIYLEFGKSNGVKELIKKTKDEILGIAKVPKAPEAERKRRIEALIEKLEEEQKPESVAKRIFDFAIGLYEKYKERHGVGSEQLEEFYNIIINAVKEGYRQAREIMEAFKVSDEVIGVTEVTMEKFFEMFDNWYEEMKEEVSSTKHIDLAA